MKFKKFLKKLWNRLFSQFPDKPIGEPSIPVNVSEIPEGIVPVRKRKDNTRPKHQYKGGLIYG